MQTQHHRQIAARDEQKVQVFAAGPYTVRLHYPAAYVVCLELLSYLSTTPAVGCLGSHV